MLDPKRQGRITASAVGAILGLSPWSDRKKQLERMIKEHQGIDTSFSNVATEYGHSNEIHARRKLETILMETVHEDGFVHVDWLGATPDGFTDSGFNVELKCPYGLRNGGEFKSIFEQPHYYAQVQIQMFLTQRDKTHFFQWNTRDHMHEVVDFSQDYIDEIMPTLTDFYNEYLEKRDTPILVERDDLINVVESIKEYDAQIEILSDLRKELLEKLQEESGGTNLKIGDHEFKQVERKGSIDYAKYAKENDLDLESYRKKDSSYWRLY